MEARRQPPRIEKIRLDTLRVPPAGKAERPFRGSEGRSDRRRVRHQQLRLPGGLPGERHQLGGRRPAPGLRHPEVRVREGERHDRVRGVRRTVDGRDGPDVPRPEPEHAGDRLRAFRRRRDSGLPNGSGDHEDRREHRAEGRIPEDAGERLLGGCPAAGVRPLRRRHPRARPARTARRLPEQPRRPRAASDRRRRTGHRHVCRTRRQAAADSVSPERGPDRVAAVPGGRAPVGRRWQPVVDDADADARPAGPPHECQ